MKNLREVLAVYDLSVSQFGEIINVGRKDLVLYETDDSRLEGYIKDKIELALQVLNKYILVAPTYDEAFISKCEYYVGLQRYIKQFRKLIKEEKESR